MGTRGMSRIWRRRWIVGLALVSAAAVLPVTTASTTSSAEAAGVTLRPQVESTLDFVAEQVRDTIDDLPSTTRFPRSTASNGSWTTVGASDWVSGFFPALLWQLYNHTGDGDFLSAAESWTASVAPQATRTDTHDVGFMVGLPASLAFEATGASTYKNSLLTAARSLATRYDPDVGATRSWDFGSWQFPVIVDNVVNVNLLVEGAEYTTSGTERASWRSMAFSHASVTANEHLRGNGSTYHVVDFNKTTGAVISRETHAGAGDETTWARGQAWAIYGFTDLYARAGGEGNLDAARAVADYFLANLPTDQVPYWDFNAPGIPSADRDASAAAIAASGLMELSTLTSGTVSDGYFEAACDILETLMSPAYLSNGSNSDGLLLHVTGNYPRGSEIDVSTIYADYFFTEALLRYLEVAPGPDADPTVSITSPDAGAVVGAPVTLAGSASDDLGVSQVLLSIRDQATNRYWNGTGFQSAVTNVAATLSAPGSASTGWSYVFDLGSAPPSSQPYVLSVKAIDSSGQQSSPSTRSFSIRDVIAPVITLIGDNPQTIPVNSPYVELGAVATDDVEGDVTSQIVIDSSSVDTTTIGSYVVTYRVTDGSGNPSLKTRTVKIIDVTPPSITLVGPNPVVLSVGDPYVEPGATAIDDVDGAIGGRIVINASAVNTALPGGYRVTYNVADSAGNDAPEQVRAVLVVGSAPPVMALAGPNPQVIPVGGTYDEFGADAWDDDDGDLSGAVVTASNVNTSLVGPYSVTYNVQDSEGNAATELTRTVIVEDVTPPSITLLGDNPLVLSVDDPYADPGATAIDDVDGAIGGRIDIEPDTIDTTSPGGYRVTYDVTDNAGNAAVQKVRTVLVVGSGEPVMALLGSVPQSIRIGNPYIELGAAAWDGADGDLSASIVIDASSVNTAKLGSYSVFYDVEDSEGNSAPRLTRTVKVIDDVAPVITLVGVNPQAIDIRQPYVEFGAQAVDNVDGDLTASIVIDSSSVDTSTPGAYIVTYDVTDTAGNDAITLSRTVKVGADLAPDIFLVGPSPQRIPFGGSYSEYGATAWDAQDGDLTGALVIDASDVDVTRPGVYLVSYSVVDAGGNPALATRVVEILDFFVDDNGSIFQRDINAIALAGITRGCNPPQNDWYCETKNVTRGQFAAMIVRALDLPAAPRDAFVDDNDSIFENDINSLAAAGVTRGCNPPDNTKYCPNEFLNRGQAAAMFVRALGYTDNGGGDKFIDDDDSVFEDDIDKLATAGVTRGCNPPENSRFCPNRFITRGQIAAFLARARGL